MKNIEDKPYLTLIELLVGIFLFECVCELVGAFFVKDITKYSMGLLLGWILASLSAVHMYRSLMRNFDMNGNNEKGAQSYAIRSNMIRYCFILIVFFVVCITDFAYPLATFLGIMGLKIGAYIQPLIHKVILTKKEL